ncbi:hypothetical protein HY312_00195 [Candidatus Saccharibacteria bacterium]|nr:hypothetical protein [Candidatus Saccharibacteria bacterium]
MINVFDMFYTTAQPDQKLAVECVDDRGYALRRDAVRIAAGPFGLAKDTLAALSIQGNKEARRVPVGVMAAYISHDLAASGFEARTHEKCAAELGAAVVARCITDEATAPETRLRAGVILGRDISDAEFSGAQRYYEQFSDPSYYDSAEREEAHMHERGVERSELAFENHAGATLISNHREGTIFQTQQAYAENAPFYAFDMWAMPRYTEAISHRLPATTAAIMASTAIRHGGITQLLPNPNGGQGIDIAHRAA